MQLFWQAGLGLRLVVLRTIYLNMENGSLENPQAQVSAA